MVEAPPNILEACFLCSYPQIHLVSYAAGWWPSSTNSCTSFLDDCVLPRDDERELYSHSLKTRCSGYVMCDTNSLKVDFILIVTQCQILCTKNWGEREPGMNYAYLWPSQPRLDKNSIEKDHRWAWFDARLSLSFHFSCMIFGKDGLGRAWEQGYPPPTPKKKKKWSLVCHWWSVLNLQILCLYIYIIVPQKPYKSKDTDNL